MSTFWPLLGFLRPYRRGVIASALLACLAMGVGVAIPYLSGKGIGAIRQGAVHPTLRHHDLGRLQLIAALIAGVAVARWLLTVGRRLIGGRVSLGVEYDLRQLLFAHLQRLELPFFEAEETGQLMSRLTVDLQAVRFFLGYGLVFILQSAVSILLAASAMFAIDPALAGAALAPVPFVVLIARRYGRLARPALQEVQQRIAELTAEAEQGISGIRVVLAFARERYQRKRFQEKVGRVFDQALKATRIEARYNPTVGFLPQLGMTAVLLWGGEQVVHAQLGLGSFSAFYFYLNMLISPMRTLGVTLGLGQRATASGARIFQLLDREPRQHPPAQPRPLPPGGGEVRFEAVHLALAREGIQWRERGEEILHGIDLRIEAGSTFAIVGPSGAGKSSLLALIARLYDPTAGTVLLDGEPVDRLSLPELRAAVAYVTQEPFLFSATVAENIAYARPQATEEEVRAAAATAQALSFIEALPEGFQTKVGERGLTLSGGQRQRLAIARAILAQPRVLVLDDATSALDATTERELLRALRAERPAQTVVIVAQRPSAVGLADRVAVLEGGRLVAHGSAEEVAAKSRFYNELIGSRQPRRRPAVAGEVA